LSLLNDILEMSKIEAGRTTLNPSAFDLHALIDDLETMFRMRAEEKELHFIVERLGHIPARYGRRVQAAAGLYKSSRLKSDMRVAD
jgi:signal transduction histidine kinase